MDAARLKRIQELFLEACDLPEPERGRYLDLACQGDHDLLSHVVAMIREDAKSDSLLDGEVARVARSVLDENGRLSGQRVGPYLLNRIIGEGGMGVVYLAEREDLGSQAAIKILRDAWLSPVRRDRFESEQRTLAQLIHPSIARLYDADTLPDGTPWFAMEYVEGVPITEYARKRSGSIDGRLRLFRAVCEAVQYAHGHAVIHRDLKPSNILVKTDGAVRLLDFGIAKQLESLGQDVDQTRTELRLMTPAYAAPEQVRGDRVGIFTDVYALGVLLYELLAGRGPFDFSNRTPGEIEKLVLEQEPDRPSAIAQRMPAASWSDLDVLCLTAMHKDPQRRYRTVDALVRDVDHYLKREPLEARPDTLRYRVGKFVARHRAAVATSVFSLAAVAGLVLFFAARLAIARNTAQATALRLERVQAFMLSLFEGGDKATAPAENLRVTTVIDRGYQEAKALQKEPQVQAELYQTLGAIYEKLGNISKADTLLNEALAERKAILGPDHPKVAESLVALGLLRVDQAKLDDAERMVRDGVQKIERARPRDEAAFAKATTALGKVLEARGTYDKAIPILERAVQLQSKIAPESADLAAAIKELADAQFYAGHYDVSDALNFRALGLHRKLFGDSHPLVAEDLINLGAVEFERAHYSQAETYYRQALSINRAWYGNDHPEVASTLSMLGRALVFEKRYDEAVGLVEQALAIQERVYGPAHPKVANVLNELGTVALQREHFDEAQARFQRMVEIYKSAYGEHHYLYALAFANLASVFLARKDYARAEPMFQEAVQRYTEALSADHLYTGIGQIKWGRALAGERRYTEAEKHLLIGYGILMKQASPSASWVQSARKELVGVYEALHEPDKAAQFREAQIQQTRANR